MGGEVSGRQIEELVDELILFANVIVTDPPHLPVCGKLLLIAGLNNLPTHKKRPKAYAEPKAARLGGGGGQNL